MTESNRTHRTTRINNTGTSGQKKPTMSKAFMISMSACALVVGAARNILDMANFLPSLMVNNGQKKERRSTPTSVSSVHDNNGGGDDESDNTDRSQPLVYPGLPNPSGLCHTYFPTQGRNASSPIRKERYPSIEERICLRMHYWYDPHFNTSRAWRSPYTFEYERGIRGWMDVIVHNNRTNDSINRQGFDKVLTTRPTCPNESTTE